MISALIAEEVAGEWNRRALAQAARAFAVDFKTSVDDESACLIALDNRPGSKCIYDFRPEAEICALVVGNEAKGIRRSTIKRAFATVEIPVISRNINCLNVAAAAAIALYYLSLPNRPTFPTRTAQFARKHRPSLLIVGGEDHMELGSVIRSACAFGWDRVYLDDRFNVWYNCARPIKSEGRGAARRGRNPIRVIPWSQEFERGFDRVIRPCGLDGLQGLRLIGPRTLLALKDDAPAAGLQFRQWASIVLAETARQLGRWDSEGIYLRSRQDRYREELAAPEAPDGITLEDLLIY